MWNYSRYEKKREREWHKKGPKIIFISFGATAVLYAGFSFRE
jgi:hypothetical protein